MERFRLPASVLALVTLAVVWLGLSAAASLLWVYGADGPVTNPTDFRAFYCGGAALDAGANPYRVEPLASCERATTALAGLVADPRHVLPAPLPPYALAAFGLFARLPFRLAAELWLGLSLLAFGYVVYGVAKLSGMRPWLPALALVLSAGYASFVIGQVVPLVLAALVFAALRARARDGAGAAAALAVASLEPHLALPAWLGLALLPFARRPLAVAAVALAAVSLAAGVERSAEFAGVVLPLHARSELYGFGAQYGLSPLLAFAGMAPAASLALGSVSYALMAVAGVVLAQALRRRYEDDAFTVVTPVATVLLGGPFVHIHQMAAALPLALMLVMRVRAGTLAHGALLSAVLALAIPWQTIAEVPGVLRVPAAARVQAPTALPAMRPNESIERPYTAYIDAFAARNDPRTPAEQLAWKLPTWLALVTLAFVAAALAFGSSARYAVPSATLRARYARRSSR